ncbi:hypothetical protein BaRGS_00009051, partial [Batillaria attramentaria]
LTPKLARLVVVVVTMRSGGLQQVRSRCPTVLSGENMRPAYRDQADRPSHKYNVHSLKESVKTNAFRCELRNRFSALDTLPEETIEEHWHDLRETWTATCREVLGKKTRQHKEWLTSDTWDLITERKRLKDLINHTDDQDHKRDLQAQYWDVN